MVVKVLLIALSCFKLLYDLFTIWLNEQQRKKPLPIEVADIYDAKRYEQYLDYKKEKRKLFLIRELLMLGFDMLIIFSDFFMWVETIAGQNVFMILFMTYFLICIVNEVISCVIGYYNTFIIEEKFGLNKKSKKEFIKERLINFIAEFVMMILLIGFVMLVGEHLGSWTNHFAMTYKKSFLICAMIFLAGFGLLMLISLISVLVMKIQYHFTPLPEGELRSQIEEALKGCKKKVRRIYVYDESKKSTSKNAFLLKLLGYREISIADNFINENDHRELMAVLSHEIGHLRHKKDLWNYLNYGILLVVFLFVVWLLPNIGIVRMYVNWVQDAFHLTVINYYVQIMVFSSLVSPLMSIVGIYHNFVSRKEEFEADGYAVSLGYGEELVKTFKSLSSDEFVNVNPAYLVEVLEYDHPGMYRRIKAILDKMKD